MSTTIETVRNGVDTETLFATLDAVKAQPGLGTFQFRVANHWSTARTTARRSRLLRRRRRGHLPCRGVPARRRRARDPDRTDTGPNPAEYLLHALAACLTTSLVYVAAARKVRLTRGGVGSRATWTCAEPRPLRRGAERIRPDPGLVRRRGRRPPEKLRELVERAKARSAVFDMVTNGVAVHVGTRLSDQRRPVRPGAAAGPPVAIDTLIVGAGQAGLALSHLLSPAPGTSTSCSSAAGSAQRWHERWDSLTLLSPNWMNGLPGVPDAAIPTATSTGPADRAPPGVRASFAAPVVEGVEVTRWSVARPDSSGRGARVPGSRETSWSRPATQPNRGALLAARMPTRSTASKYRRPDLLPDGPVSWSAPARRASSSRSSCAAPGERSFSRSVVIRAPRGGTAGATSSTGSSCSATSTSRSTRCPTQKRRSACRCSP